MKKREKFDGTRNGVHHDREGGPRVLYVVLTCVKVFHFVSGRAHVPGATRFADLFSLINRFNPLKALLIVVLLALW